MAVPEHMEAFGVFGKLLIKIEHVPVRVTLSHDRYESKIVALQAKAFAIGLDQAFRRECGGTVERSLHRERTGFRRGKDFRLSIDRSRRGKHNPFAALLAHGF